MSILWKRITLAVALLILSITPRKSGGQGCFDFYDALVKNSYLVPPGNDDDDISDGELEQWCIADEQTPDDELQMAMDWACGRGGANCSQIQLNQPCYLPNTVRDHASYTFNNHFQKFKHKGGSCFFKGAAMITELDPSHRSCSYDFIP